MLFSKFEVSLFVKFLCNIEMSVFKKIASVFGYKSDHVVILSTLFIHGNCKIVFLNNNVHFLCFLEFLLLLEFFGLFNIKIGDFSFRKIFFCNSQSLFPFTCLSVHLKSIDWKCSFEIIFFSKVVLSDG